MAAEKKTVLFVKSQMRYKKGKRDQILSERRRGREGERKLESRYVKWGVKHGNKEIWGYMWGYTYKKPFVHILPDFVRPQADELTNCTSKIKYEPLYKPAFDARRHTNLALNSITIGNTCT